jgi:fibrillarin-like pre-rRNA processing protein
MIEINKLFEGIFKIERERDILATKNMTPGKTVYGESTFQVGEVEYRSWNPFRSKLAAALSKGLDLMPIKPGGLVLYLGAASGTTISHVSDIIGEEGHVWGVEFSPRSLRDLIDKVSRFRRNVSPILGDARNPMEYSPLLPFVDVIFSDVAQPNQAEIVIDNAAIFLRKGGWVILSIKSRSIDVSKEPDEVYESQIKILRQGDLETERLIRLNPLEKDHALAVAQYL